jgi:Ca2+-binding EF-hand superfamily protein
VPVERLTDALLALGHDSRKDISFEEFLIEHELNETYFGSLDFEQFAVLVLEYEEKLRIEEEALRRLDLKIAFECFDINKGRLIMSFYWLFIFFIDGMIDANELSNIMNILKFPITDQEAKEMIEFADHDKGIAFLQLSINVIFYLQKILYCPSMNSLPFSHKSLQLTLHKLYHSRFANFQ